MKPSTLCKLLINAPAAFPGGTVCKSSPRQRLAWSSAASFLRSHSESGLGISVQVLWPVGAPVSLIRFKDANQLILDTGTVVSNVDTPPAGGCRTSVEIKMDNVEDCRDVLGFH